MELYLTMAIVAGIIIALFMLEEGEGSTLLGSLLVLFMISGLGAIVWFGVWAFSRILA
jgi:hypothetical protein